MPTANITYGTQIGNHDIIYRSLAIAAECGFQTEYEVEFEYKDIKSYDEDSIDDEDGGYIDDDGTFIMPSFDDKFEFEFIAE